MLVDHRADRRSTSRRALWLLWWTRRSPRRPTLDDRHHGHVWDEDLTEFNNPLPRWWMWLFIITIVFGACTWRCIPGSATTRARSAGRRAPSTMRRRAANAARIERTLAPFAARAVDRAARAIRRRSASAATCSSTTAPPATARMARGAPGYPEPHRSGLAVGRRRRHRRWPPIARRTHGRDAALGRSAGRRAGSRMSLGYVFSLQGTQLAAGDAHAGRAAVRAAVLRLPWRGRRGQPRARRAQPARRRLAARRRARDRARQHREGPRTARCPRMPRASATRASNLLAAYVLSLSAAGAACRRRRALSRFDALTRPRSASRAIASAGLRSSPRRRDDGVLRVRRPAGTVADDAPSWWGPRMRGLRDRLLLLLVRRRRSPPR